MNRITFLRTGELKIFSSDRVLGAITAGLELNITLDSTTNPALLGHLCREARLP